MSKAVRASWLVMMLAAAGAALSALPAELKDFTFDEKTNRRWRVGSRSPSIFAIPASARAVLPKTIETTDRLIDFKHPDAEGSQGDVGLRLVVARRAGMAQRLGKSGLVQTGDLLLTFRAEWGGAGAYPNVQMGISHTGIAYIKDGILHNIDNPLNAEYLGARGELNSEHYNTLQFIHVIRPRNLTDAQRANLLEWTSRLAAGAGRSTPSRSRSTRTTTHPNSSASGRSNSSSTWVRSRLGRTRPAPSTRSARSSPRPCSRSGTATRP